MAFLARFLALSESGAEITDPIMWLLWGMLLAAIRQRFSGFRPIVNLSCDAAHAALAPAYKPRCANPATDGTRLVPKFTLRFDEYLLSLWLPSCAG